MLNLFKSIILSLVLTILSGCGAIIKQIESTWDDDDRTVYAPSQPLPTLEIPPDLSGAQPIQPAKNDPKLPSNFSRRP